MDTTAFKKAYGESRNGASHFIRHGLVRSFQYSDGVGECADAGCHWLVDIAATELPALMRRAGAPSAFLEVHVESGKADLKLTVEDDAPPLWKRDIDYTDMPDGDYTFELADESDRVAMILISEH